MKVRRVLVRIVRALCFFLKQWGVYIAQGAIVLLTLIGTGYIEGIPRDSSRAYVVDAGIAAFFASAKVLRGVRPRSKLVLEYARRVYRLAQWTIIVAAASIAPNVLGLFQFLGKLNDLTQNVLLVIGVLAFITLLGNFTGLADIFKRMEDEMVKKFEAENPTVNPLKSV